MSGYVIYRGPSLLDGAPIVVVALLPAGLPNRKTGAVVQTYILADNGALPFRNVASGADVSICGDCKHRPALGGGCYVAVARGPTAVYKALMRGNYPALEPAAVAEVYAGVMVRLGSYGDPAAVPMSVWRALLSCSPSHVGYTHQWRNPAISLYKRTAMQGILMASCDTPAERDEARGLGWRAFTVRMPGEVLAPRESVCPASEEGGRKLQCSSCGACNGAGTGRHGSIAIVVHGFQASRYTKQREIRA